VATIKDVARLAGVGLGTASRVVSGKGAVSPAT
jgi:LacI family transcriptional regulator